jgi:DNA-binding MarR family transcriptional regulator
MPKLTKKEGLFLSRLQDQGGRLAISGNKYDRLIKAGYVIPEHDSFGPNIIHYTLTETGRGALEIHKKKALVPAFTEP